MRLLLGLAWLCIVTPATVSAEPAVEFTAAERTAILSLGPWPPEVRLDTSNRVAGSADAIALGEMLFFDKNLSGSKNFACASCHIPGKQFTDGLETGVGAAPLPRNTPTVFNLNSNRWFGWGGETDSLWSQSIRPIVAVEEMGSTAAAVKAYIHTNKTLRSLYHRVFDRSPDEDTPENVLINTGKTLAAYQATLLTDRTPFDEFRDAVAASEDTDHIDYPLAAQRGLKIFVGRGRCNLCHFGPKFSNGEFADIGIPFFTGEGVDAGRYSGIKSLKSNPLNLLGEHNDDGTHSNAVSTQHVALQHRNWGEFKVPSLRGVAETAPYMHNGSLATLRDVVLHYSEINEERLHSDGEKILRPLHLSEQEVDDLVAFLNSLSTHR